MKKFYKWMKKDRVSNTMIEVTKDYFSDDDEFINEKNGWVKLDQYVEIKEDVIDGKEDD